MRARISFDVFTPEATGHLADSTLVGWREQNQFGFDGLVGADGRAFSLDDEVVKRARDSRFDFLYLKDDGSVVARRFEAVTTPHAFVLDEERRLRYSGRLADSRQASTSTVSYIERAVNDILAGREVAVAETEPYGCSIVW